MSDETPTEPTAPAERPAWLPDKFKDAEQMAQAYAHLEQKFSGGTPDPTPADAPVAPVTEAPTADGLPTIPQPGDAPAASPDSDALWGTEATASYSDAIQETGDLTAEQKAALVASGIPEPMIANYVEGHKAQVKLTTQTVMQITGGTENYESMVKWAHATLPQGEQLAYNAAIDSGDVNQASAAVRGLYAQFKGSSGSPMITRGDAPQAGGSFENQAQLQAAIKNPLYKTDESYRKQVQTKLSNSRF